MKLSIGGALGLLALVAMAVPLFMDWLGHWGVRV